METSLPFYIYIKKIQQLFPIPFEVYFMKIDTVSRNLASQGPHQTFIDLLSGEPFEAVC